MRAPARRARKTRRGILTHVTMDGRQQPHGDARRRIRRVRIALWILVAVAAALETFLYVTSLPPAIGEYDAFAKCVADTSTTFYGAFWCSHCADQKREFGDAAKYLPYVECSTPDAQGETAACKAMGITGYPTWVFPGNATATGEQTLETISAKTGCPLPTSS